MFDNFDVSCRPWFVVSFCEECFSIFFGVAIARSLSVRVVESS